MPATDDKSASYDHYSTSYCSAWAMSLKQPECPSAAAKMILMVMANCAGVGELPLSYLFEKSCMKDKRDLMPTIKSLVEAGLIEASVNKDDASLTYRFIFDGGRQS